MINFTRISPPLLSLPPPHSLFRSVRSHNKRREPKKKLHMSTELLDLDEALTFLEGVAQSPEEMAKATAPQMQKWKTPISPAPSPEPHQRVS